MRVCQFRHYGAMKTSLNWMAQSTLTEFLVLQTLPRLSIPPKLGRLLTRE
jgi:hypothetical protein